MRRPDGRRAILHRHALRPPKIAVPTRTRVAPSAIAISTSSLMPIDSSLRSTLGRGRVASRSRRARNKHGEIVGAGDMRAQIQQVGENLKNALEAAGATLNDLVKTTTFVTDIDEFFRHVDIRHDYLGVSLPASTTVEVRRLSHPDLLVEIEAMAVLKS